jgi:hypothetical protein
MTIEGDLVVRLDCDRGAVRRVTVRSTRPFAASRVLRGRTPDDAVATVPRLFSVCGRAQETAAAGALAAARGEEEAPQVQARRERDVLLETIEEYLRRVLVDWPEAMGQPAATAPVAAARRAVAAARSDDCDRSALAHALGEIAARHVYGGVPGAWLALTDGADVDAWTERAQTLPARLFAELLRWWPRLGRSDVPLMPAPCRETLLTAVLPAMCTVPGFEGAPVWAGAPVETGALARMHAHPLVRALAMRCGNAVPTRMVARLLELAALLGQLAAAPRIGDDASRMHAFPVAQGEGVAAVQTARGLLLHHARVAAGRVAAYQIVAPTEWNFHPAGPLARGLAGMTAGDDAALVRGATLAVQALDPCVACAIEVAHA